MNYIESIETDKVQLEIFECTKCNFHLGIDATYLDQVGALDVICPNCKNEVTIHEE